MFGKLINHLQYFLGDFWPYLLLVSGLLILCLILAYKVFKSTFSIKSKKIILSLIFTLITIVLSFTAFEAYFRYVYDEPDGLGFLKVNKKWHERHVIYNSHFFRDRDFSPIKTEGVTRIGILGDSITFGGGIEKVEDRFSNILEKKLRDADRKVEVYNFGRPGYDTEGEIPVYNSIKYLDVDVLVWQYFLNDIQALENSPGTAILNKNSQKSRVIKFISDRSYFLDFVYWRLSLKYQKTIVELKTADFEKYKDQERLNQHKKEISHFIDQLKKENKRVIVVIFPSVYFLGPNYPAKDIHDLMSAYFRENGVQVVDLLDDLKEKDAQTLVASKFDAHPNEYVHRLVAERLYEIIRPLLVN